MNIIKNERIMLKRGMMNYLAADAKVDEKINKRFIKKGKNLRYSNENSLKKEMINIIIRNNLENLLLNFYHIITNSSKFNEIGFYVSPIYDVEDCIESYTYMRSKNYYFENIAKGNQTPSIQILDNFSCYSYSSYLSKNNIRKIINNLNPIFGKRRNIENHNHYYHNSEECYKRYNVSLFLCTYLLIIAIVYSDSEKEIRYFLKHIRYIFSDIKVAKEHPSRNVLKSFEDRDPNYIDFVEHCLNKMTTFKWMGECRDINKVITYRDVVEEFRNINMQCIFKKELKKIGGNN